MGIINPPFYCKGCSYCDSKCVRYIVSLTMGLTDFSVMTAQEAALASKITGQSLYVLGNLTAKDQTSEKNANELAIGVQGETTCGSVTLLQDKHDHPGLDFLSLSACYNKIFEKRVVPQNCNPYTSGQENSYDVVNHYTPVMCTAA